MGQMSDERYVFIVMVSDGYDAFPKAVFLDERSARAYVDRHAEQLLESYSELVVERWPVGETGWQSVEIIVTAKSERYLRQFGVDNPGRCLPATSDVRVFEDQGRDDEQGDEEHWNAQAPLKAQAALIHR
jgi:hypothetical protein